jgi:hypothetical protein
MPNDPRTRTPSVTGPARLAELAGLLETDASPPRRFLGGLVIGALAGAALAGATVARRRAKGDRAR